MHPWQALLLINSFAMLSTIERTTFESDLSRTTVAEVFSFLRTEIVETLHRSRQKIGGQRKVVCVDETHFTKRKRNAGGFGGKWTLGPVHGKDRQKDRKTDRKTERKTQRPRERQKGRQKERKTERHQEGQKERHPEVLKERHQDQHRKGFSKLKQKEREQAPPLTRSQDSGYGWHGAVVEGGQSA